MLHLVAHAGGLEVAAQLLGQGEEERLLRGGDRLRLAVAPLGEEVEDPAHEDLGHGGSGGDTDGAHTVEPGLVDLVGVVDEVTIARAVLDGDFDEAHRVGGVARADDDHQVAVLGHLLDGELTVLRRVADVVGGRVLQLGELLPQPAHRLHRLVDREGGLRQPHDLVGVADLDVGDVVGALDEGDVLGRLAGGADDLLVPLVTDEQDVEVVVGEADRLAVDLGDQRAGRIDRLEAEGLGLLVDDRGDAVGGKHDGRALGHLVGLLDEDRAPLLEGRHDVLVVDDLLAHVDRRAVELEGLFDRDDGTVDTGAVAAGRGEQDALGILRGGGVGGRGRTGGHAFHRR